MIKNRAIKASKGIPLENIVIDEIPIEKATSIGHLNAESNTSRNMDKKQR